jgi:hypothetical protein
VSSPDRQEPEALRERLVALHAKLAPRLPEIDPGDLLLILECLLRPVGSGRQLFLREIEPHVYAP